jgi:hypothetical protein
MGWRLKLGACLLKRWVFLFLGLAILPWAARAAPAGAPSDLRLTWIHGVCRHCRTATTLSQVQFVSPVEAWAIGYAPPGETGAGDYSILHTKDGARTWKEYPSSYSHNDPPQFSFPDRREGWMLVADVPNAERRLLSTSDGGGHWRRLGLRDLDVDQIDYLGDGVGFTHLFDNDSNVSRIYSTVDGGRRWTKRLLPNGFSVDRMSFIDVRRGFLAGCLDTQIVVLRTADGGRRWDIAHLDLPKAAAGRKYCDLSVDDLSVQADGRGLLLVNKSMFNNGDSSNFAGVFRTDDGGATWTPVYRKTLAIPLVSSAEPGVTGYMQVFPTFTAARRLDAHTMFVSKDDGLLSISSDDGGRWREEQLPHPLGACRSSLFGLACAAGDPNAFWVLRVSAKP